MINRISVARAGSVDSLRAASLNMLALPGVVADPDVDTRCLTSLIANSYAVGIVDGQLVIPADEVSQDNIGVLCMMPGEESQIVNASEYLGNLPSQDTAGVRSETLEQASRRFSYTSRELRLAATGARHHSATLHSGNSRDDPRIRSRSLLVVSPEITALSPTVSGAIFTHEVDHAAFLRKNSREAPRLYEKDNVLVKRTMIERGAHLVGYSLLIHSGEMDDLPSPDEIIAARRQGTDTERLFARVDTTTVEGAMKSGPLHAKLIDTMLGRPRGVAGNREVAAYMGFGLVNGGY